MYLCHNKQYDLCRLVSPRWRQHQTRSAGIHQQDYLVCYRFPFGFSAWNDYLCCRRHHHLKHENQEPHQEPRRELRKSTQSLQRATRAIFVMDVAWRIFRCSQRVECRLFGFLTLSQQHQASGNFATGRLVGWFHKTCPADRQVNSVDFAGSDCSRTDKGVNSQHELVRIAIAHQGGVKDGSRTPGAD